LDPQQPQRPRSEASRTIFEPRSFIYTAKLRNEYPFDYPTVVLRDEKAVAGNLASWLS